MHSEVTEPDESVELNSCFGGDWARVTVDCELPDDVVFTVEYSIRSAQTAVYDLLGLNRKPPAVYKGQYDPRVLYKAFTTLHDMKA